MIGIEIIDQNWKVTCRLDRELRDAFDFYDPEQAPFSIHGVFREGDCFVRMPRRIAGEVSERVAVLNEHTAGGRIRFVTDSARIALIAAVAPGGGMPHFAYAGVSGFDLYASSDGEMHYRGTFVPPLDHDGGYEGYIRPDHGRHLWGEGPGSVRPGYGLYDRALGVMYMLGVWDMLDKLDQEK